MVKRCKVVGRDEECGSRALYFLTRAGVLWFMKVKHLENMVGAAG